MKMRNKGKVHPFTTTTSSSSSSSSSTTDSFSVLKLLPAAILTLVSYLSLEDREVLAYMITRSLKSTNPSFFPAANEDKKKSSKKQCGGGHNSPALFDCDCFHCYTSFWFRWDSSPNRELIHQAIEAFDDHLNTGDHFKNARTKRRDRLGRRRSDKAGKDAFVAGGHLDYPPAESPANQELSISAVASPEVSVLMKEVDEVEHRIEGVDAEDESVAAAGAVVRTHKGLARKVLPDVMGIFSSRLWSLWSPNV